MKKTALILSLTLIIITFLGCKNIKSEEEVNRQYLVFEMTNVTSLEARIQELITIFGENDIKSKRMFAFGINAIPCLTRSVADLKKKVNEGFDLAEKYDVPVMFHIDPMYGLGVTHEIEKDEEPEIKYWEHPDMCEWVNFPENGKTHGRVPRCWFNWGSWFSPAPAVPCFASPRLKKFIVSQLKNGITEPIMKRYVKLKKQNKDYLFVGLNIGWETHIPDHSYWADKEGPIVSMHSDDVIMQKWEMAKSGFAALHHKGWNDKKLAAEAKKQNISTNELFFNLCSEVIHDYMELLAKTAFDDGIPKNKIYTHIVPTHSVDPIPISTFRPPVWTAVNKYSIPGFTMGIKNGAKYEINNLKKIIKKADPAQNKFVAAECYVLHKKNEKEFAEFMNELFDDANPIMCVYGALGGGESAMKTYGIQTKPVDETLAMIKWLKK
ncbi:MAG: hypothetical protein KAS17_08955 [Victivallaceae bacterium]|nr:hypothetical protein [Victivallaceae bacterium]